MFFANSVYLKPNIWLFHDTHEPVRGESPFELKGAVYFGNPNASGGDEAGEILPYS